ncbi:MAG: putative permease [Candidatus Midichloriaceae bacterium]|jgi:putative permease
MNYFKNTVSTQLFLIVICFVLFFSFMYTFIDIITPFLLAFCFAYILDPIVVYLSKKKNINKSFSVSIVLCAFFSIFFVAFYYLVPLSITQASNIAEQLNLNNKIFNAEIFYKLDSFVKSSYPQIYDSLQELYSNINSYIFKFIKEIFGNLVQSGKVMLNLATIFLVTPVFTFYFLFDMDEIKKYIKNLIPKYYKSDINQLFSQINITFSNYLRGQLTVSILLGLYYTAGLLLLNIKYSIVLGMMSGISLFVPYVGVLLSFFVVSIISYIQFKSFTIFVYVCVIYICGHLLEGGFVTPKLIGKKLNLHPLWIFFGLFFWGSLFGFFGILFAIPLTAVTAVFIRFTIGLYKKSKIYNY